MKIYCAFCCQLFEEIVSKPLKANSEFVRPVCSHCQKINYLKDIEIRCPYCCFYFVERLPQPSYDAGDIENTCPKCQHVFTLHLDNFVKSPQFEISYKDLLFVLKNYSDPNLGRLFFTLQLKQKSFDLDNIEDWIFLDRRTGILLNIKQVHERILRNRDVCHSFYGLLMSLIR